MQIGYHETLINELINKTNETAWIINDARQWYIWSGAQHYRRRRLFGWVVMVDLARIPADSHSRAYRWHTYIWPSVSDTSHKPDCQREPGPTTHTTASLAGASMLSLIQPVRPYSVPTSTVWPGDPRQWWSCNNCARPDRATPDERLLMTRGERWRPGGPRQSGLAAPVGRRAVDDGEQRLCVIHTNCLRPPSESTDWRRVV